jgi:hypothetical protein
MPNRYSNGRHGKPVFGSQKSIYVQVDILSLHNDRFGSMPCRLPVMASAVFVDATEAGFIALLAMVLLGCRGPEFYPRAPIADYLPAAAFFASISLRYLAKLTAAASGVIPGTLLGTPVTDCAGGMAAAAGNDAGGIGAGATAAA